MKENLKYVPSIDQSVLLDAGWLHDTVEDCKINHGYIENNYGYFVSFNVKALTNLPDGNPNYKLLVKESYARMIKLADRITHLEVNLTILNNKELFEHLPIYNLFNDAKKYLKKYLNQNEDFINGLELNKPVKPFEYELVKEYFKLSQKLINFDFEKIII